MFYVDDIIKNNNTGKIYKIVKEHWPDWFDQHVRFDLANMNNIDDNLTEVVLLGHLWTKVNNEETEF